MKESKVQARLGNLRIAPRKVRSVAKMLKGIPANEALARLQMIRSRSALPLSKLLKSGIANAKNQNLNVNKLVIQSITVEEGPVLKRLSLRAMGRATLIQKKLSHVNLVLVESLRIPAPRFTLYETPKVSKVKKAEAEKERKFKEKEEEKPRMKTREGFLQRIFRRKAI